MFWKVTLPSALIFLQKLFARLTSQVFLPLLVEQNPYISNSDNSHSPLTRTKSNFPWISSHFSFIFYSTVNSNSDIRILRWLKINFLSFDQKLRKIYASNSNSGSWNSTQIPSN